MKAMILAAGLGTRLRPLTDNQPKALVKVAGVPLLEIVIRRLIAQGFTELIVNVHHFGEQIIRFLQEKNNFGVRIEISDERELLLNTGGALKNADWFFNDRHPFLLCNTDILTDIDLHQLYQTHCQSHPLATLAVQQRQSSRFFIFDAELTLNGWGNSQTGRIKLPRSTGSELQMLAFSGIHIIDPKIFALMPAEAVFSIIDLYLNAAANYTIKGFRHDADQWIDVGRESSLEAAEDLAKELLKRG